MGKILIIAGVVLVVVGLAIQYAGKIPFLGRLPGDIVYERENVKIYVPIMTCIVISIVVSLILFLIGRLRG